MMKQTEALIGLDIGGTKIEAMAATPDLTLLAGAVIPTDSRTPDRLVSSIERAVDQALQRAGLPAARVAAMGAGAPGMVDHVTGEVRLAVNLNLHDYPLGPALAERFGCPVVLENDVRLAAMGVYDHLRQGQPDRYRNLRDLAYISLGTGVAAGLILNGALYRGARGMAGEIGHIQVNQDGPLCNCGAHGCLEMYISGTAIGRMAEEALARGDGRSRASLLQRQRPATAKLVYAAARAGDPLAQAIADRVGDYVSRTLYAVLLAYDVEVLALGGGVVHAGDAFLKPVMAGVDRLRADLPLARQLLDPAMVAAAPARNMGAWGGVVMAAAAARRVRV